ncbi:MAG: SH3 domain-containing protein [Thermacetogeniaceae bacterium]
MKKRALSLAGLLLIGAVIGFLIASAVYAGGAEPGSASDPLVARSYADERMRSYVSELEKKVAELSARAQKLEEELASLQKRVGAAPISSGAASGSQSTSVQAAGFQVGQKLYILPGNSAVNLRQGPGANYAVVGTAVRGSGCEPLTVISRSGDWYQVRLADGRTGWVAGWLLTAAS